MLSLCGSCGLVWYAIGPALSSLWNPRYKYAMSRIELNLHSKKKKKERKKETEEKIKKVLKFK